MELIETGKIVGTHGIAGDVKVQAWADSPDVLLDFEYIYISFMGNQRGLLSFSM